MARSSTDVVRYLPVVGILLAVLVVLQRKDRRPADADGVPAELSRPAAATADASASPRPAEPRGYIRRLVVDEVPPPGSSGPARPPAGAPAADAPDAAGSAGAAFGAPRLAPSFSGFGPGGASSSDGGGWSGPAAGTDGRPRGGGARAAVAVAAARAKPSAANGDARWSPETAGVLSGLKKLKDSSAQTSSWEKTPAGAALAHQLAADAATDADVRAALADAARSGRGSLPEARAKTVAGVLVAHGLSATPDEVALALARASAPPPPAIPPDVAAATASQFLAAQATPQEAAAIQQAADNPPPRPSSPAPRGAIEAYKQNQDVFAQADAQYGVKRQDILAILGVETSYGNNTGTSPLAKTLDGLRQQQGPDGRPTARAAQAERDNAALFRLAANDQLGGRPVGEIKASWAGAMGDPQFLPTSWEAYGRAAGSGAKNPWNMPDSIVSIANYLSRHGYQQSAAQSFFGYNHSQDYVNKVSQLSTNIEAGLRKQDAAP